MPATYAKEDYILTPQNDLNTQGPGAEAEEIDKTDFDQPDLQPAPEDESGEEVQTADQEKSQRKMDLLTEALDYVKTFLIVLVLALLLTQFVIQRNTVKGESMVPTLHDGDELFVEKVTRYFGAIHRFDIITVDTHWVETDHPNRVIKRVIGLPGEEVELKDGKVYINGQELDQPFLDPQLKTVARDLRFSKLKLGENEYYVLGDNRNNSTDSRYYGPVPQSAILGKLLVRFYPFDSMGVPK